MSDHLITSIVFIVMPISILSVVVMILFSREDIDYE